MIALADALTDAGVKFAFGGALALAYHVVNPRATTDIDVDILVEPTESTIARLVDILGTLFEIPPSKSAELLAMGQARLMWDHIPV
ncbi:MAG: nucleotidyl transferase AbiEii/AbiGii toxin family protein, partial [Actinomycetota bacterium]